MLTLDPVELFARTAAQNVNRAKLFGGGLNEGGIATVIVCVETAETLTSRPPGMLMFGVNELLSWSYVVASPRAVAKAVPAPTSGAPDELTQFAAGGVGPTAPSE